MIHQLNIYGKDKVQVAIERLQTAEPKEGYYLAFSGGKDSCCLKALADMANVRYDAHYNNTGVDPPEVLRFMKKNYPDVIWETPRDKDGKRITMWNLIPKEKYPPTRIVRYCCEALKENGGIGRFVLTGVRWNESVRRKDSRHLLEDFGKGKGKGYSTDNIDDAPMFKFCHGKSKRILNPIIDWTTDEVWEFIHEYNVPYCELYDQGVKRIGCIGCPMGGHRREAEFKRYPKYKELYIKAFDRMVEERKKAGLRSELWQCGEDVMEWWLKGNGGSAKR